MNDFIGGNSPTEEQLNAKKWMKIIGIILIFLLIVVIGLIVLMYYIEETRLKINVDGKETTKLNNVFIFTDETIYIPIRTFAKYLGYESGNGDYKQYAEDITKCYTQSTNEVASFTLGSNKIYKILLDGNNDYEYYEISDPIKMINNELCINIQGADIAFNVSMSYNKSNNKIDIYTLPYLVKYYTAKFQNAGIADEKASFSNQKALLYNMIIVKNANNNYGVTTLRGKEILGTKYSSIKFIESTKEFIVTTPENKMGIMYYDGNIQTCITKISPDYEDIKQIDKDNGLYLVTNNKKQGVINQNGNIVIHLEYDQIGVDGTKFMSNNIKNQYLLYDNCIPVKRNELWGLFDKTGKKITDVKFQNLGCSIEKGKDNSNSENYNDILLVPEYKGIIVKEKDKYGLIDSGGKQLLPTALQTIYSITTLGKDNYFMVYNNQIINVIDYIKKNVKVEENENIENTDTNAETNVENNNINNDTITE